MFGQDGVVVPGTRSNDVLQRPHAAVRPVLGPQQAQRHGFHVLARHLGHEQTPQVDLRPVPLFLPRKQRREPRVIGHHLVGDALYMDASGLRISDGR